MIKCFFCESMQVVIVGSAMLESTQLFYDVTECLECGGIQLIAPRQVVIGNLVVMTTDNQKVGSTEVRSSPIVETIGETK